MRNRSRGFHDDDQILYYCSPRSLFGEIIFNLLFVISRVCPRFGCRRRHRETMMVRRTEDKDLWGMHVSRYDFMDLHFFIITNNKKNNQMEIILSPQ